MNNTEGLFKIHQIKEVNLINIIMESERKRNIVQSYQFLNFIFTYVLVVINKIYVDFIVCVCVCLQIFFYIQYYIVKMQNKITIYLIIL